MTRSRELNELIKLVKMVQDCKFPSISRILKNMLYGYEAEVIERLESINLNNIIKDLENNNE